MSNNFCGNSDSIKFIVVEPTQNITITGDTFVTGFTYSNGNLTILQNQGQLPLSVALPIYNGNRWYIPSGTTVTVTPEFQYFVYGDMYIDGTLDLELDSQLVVLNGDLILGGTGNIIGLGTPYLISLPDTQISGVTFNNNILTITETNGDVFTTIIPTFSGNTSVDTFVTGFTFNNTTYDLTISQNEGQPDKTINLGILAQDVNVTGGTYNPSNGVATFYNNIGGSFSVSGFITGFTDIHLSAVTYNTSTGVLKLTETDGTQFSVSGLKFTGNTSGDCITDIYTSNIHSCSPLRINPLDEGNVYFGSTSGITIDLSNKRIGVGTKDPTATIHTKGIDSSSSNYGLKVQDSGTTNNFVVRNDGLITGDGIGGNSFQLGSYSNSIEGDLTVGRVERDVNTTFSIYGANYPSLKFDSIYPTKISLISGGGGQRLELTDNVNPKFTWLSSTNIGINIPNTASTINAELEVYGNTKTTNFQMTSGATNGYVLSSDSLGNAIWIPGSSISGVTDTFVTGFTYSNNNLSISQNQGQSPLTVNVSVMTGLTVNGRLTVTGDTSVKDITGTSAVFSGTGSNILTVIGSGTTSPIFKVQGSSGELFSITDSLTGSLFSVNDISGLPILEAFSDNTILMGSYLAPSLNTTTKVTANAGVTPIYYIPTSAYTGSFYDYTVMSSVGARSGNIMSIWSGTSVNYTETTTTSIGDTSGITFSVSLSGSTAMLSTSANTNSWTVKTIIRSI